MPHPEPKAAVSPVDVELEKILALGDYTAAALGTVDASGSIFRVTTPRHSQAVALRYFPIGELPRQVVEACIEEITHTVRYRHLNIMVQHPPLLKQDSLLIETEFCVGGRLEYYIQNVKASGYALEESKVWMFVAQIAAGLAYLHSPRNGLGVRPHGALRPGNIAFRSDVTLKIGDYGLTKTLSTLAPEAYEQAMRYAAPEVRQTGIPSPPGDIWSVGCITYELCTFKKPSMPASAMLRRVKLGLQGYSPELCKFISSCLQVDPDARLTAEKALGLPQVKGAANELSKRVKERAEVSDDPTAPNQFDDDPRLAALKMAIKADSYELAKANVEHLTEGSASELLKYAIKARSVTVLPILCNKISERHILVELGAQKPLARQKDDTALIQALREEAPISIEGCRDQLGILTSTGSALIWAARSARVDVIPDLLCELGLQDRTGLTALMEAAGRGFLGCARYLQAEARMRTLDGITALMWAAIGGHESCVQLLKEYEEGLQTTKSFKLGRYHGGGWTALMFAACEGHPACVTLLLSEQALRNTFGESALDLARRQLADGCAWDAFRYRHCIRLLEEASTPLDRPSSG
ncbi:Kinase, NEK [Giardia muris]|uniref:non-specific serine/threonine protein kinase n=1 Tax=Giardia muris TaxID=5742 RepID=A0A4Z1SMP5_GIAMU|nr:Kinase, NEK [Giardia muris]|eukprot:TNJ26964.1 Kinase, NEK [Giardia muris]